MALEIAVECSSKHRADSPYGIESIRSASQVRHGAEKFKRMAFLLEGIVRGTFTEDFYISRKSIYLKCIVSAGNYISRNFERHTYTGFFVVGTVAFFDDYLDIFE